MRGLISIRSILASSLLVGISPQKSHAANFVSAVYDARTDELVVTLSYRGTNPDHQFTLQWEDCRSSNGSSAIAARIHDSQWNDRAIDSFTKTIRFDLADLRCRPAEVTLFTAPNFRIGVSIPATAGGEERSLRGPRTDAH